MHTHSSVRRAWNRWRMRVNTVPVHVHEPSKRRVLRHHQHRHAEQHPVRWAQGFDRPLG